MVKHWPSMLKVLGSVFRTMRHPKQPHNKTPHYNKHIKIQVNSKNARNELERRIVSLESLKKQSGVEILLLG